MPDSTPRRSLLFVPALRPDRYLKAERSGADLMCIDLEDAVPPTRKEEARGLALPYFDAPRAAGGARRFLRINSPRLPDGARDLVALLDASARPDGVVVPKVRGADEVRWVDELLASAHPGLEILPLIETPDALAAADAIATASPRVRAVAFGFVDYAAATGSGLGWQALLYPRGRLVAAAAAAGIEALDGTWLDLDDTDGLREEARHAAALGFGGKLAVHPAQITVIHAAFAPSPEAVDEARRILDAFERSPDGVVVVDGRLVDEPVVKVARRTLAIAGRTPAGSAG